MSLEELAYIAQIVGVAGVIISLVFVGFQVRQHTDALRRSEHNATMGEWSTIRMSIACSREIAELITGGLRGEATLDAADQLRLEHFLNEYTWACFHIWDRTQRGLFPKGTFEATAGPLLVDVLATPRGLAWRSQAKRTSYIPAFVVAVDAVLATTPSAVIPETART